MTQVGYKLEYRFIAETFNGNIIRQPDDDNPRFQDVGSSFSEVLKEHIKRFSLIGKGHIFTVDLIDGHIEADGNKLYPPKTPPIPGSLDLIYYRTVQRSANVEYQVGGIIGMLGMKPKELAPKVVYYIGWQKNYMGKNYKFEMGID